MRLAINPQNSNEVRKKTRIVLEKFHDITFGKKFKKRISRNAIANKLGKAADIQVCMHFIVECYNCFLNSHKHSDVFHDHKYQVLLKNVHALDAKISESVKTQRPIPRKYIANVLKAHTDYFNSVRTHKFNNNCSDTYDKFVLSAISVWNNHWK